MSNGAGRSAAPRTPPSTTRPPSANVRPNRRPRRASGGLGQRRRIDLAPMQRRERLCHRKRQLRARPQPDVRRNRLDNAQTGAARKPQHVAAALRERQRTLRLGALRRQFVGGLRFEYHRRTAD